jgi:hypothetical protein
VADQDKKELAEAIAEQIATALAKKKAGEDIIAATELRKDVNQNMSDISALKQVVYKEHEPVIIWSRNFSDSYRKIVTAVVISGLITLAGFLVQVYYLLQSKR